MKIEYMEKTMLAIFIDLKKAIDMVSHKMLLKRIEEYGIRGVCL